MRRPWIINVYPDNSGEWRFNLRSSNNKILLDSGEGYGRKADAEKAAERLRKALTEGRQVIVTVQPTKPADGTEWFPAK